MPSARRAEDSAVFRTASNVGFNARVEPIFYSIERLRPSLGYFDYRRRRRKVQRLLDVVAEELARQGAGDMRWTSVEGRCVCNLRVARLGLLSDLRRYAARDASPHGEDRFPHLVRHRDRDAYYLPVRFPRPFSVAVEPADPVPVGSAVMLAEEMAELNLRLRVESTFRLKQMVDFLDATQEHIGMYESKFGTDDLFWVKFGYVILQKLVRKSLEHNVPIIFA